MQTLCPESGLRTAPNWPKIRKMTMTSQFSDMTSTSNFFDVVLFLLSSLVTGPSFMSMSSLVLELWQFLFIRDWPELRSGTPRLGLKIIWSKTKPRELIILAKQKKYQKPNFMVFPKYFRHWKCYILALH